MEWQPQRGPAEERPRSRASGPAASLSLKETHHTESAVARKPTPTITAASPPTDESVDALWFILPVDAQEVDGDASEHDDQAHATDHRL